MVDFYKGNIPIYNPDTAAHRDILFDKRFERGYVQRDYRLYPQSMFEQPSEMTLCKETDWDALFDEQEEKESSIEHVFLRGGKPTFVNLDQNGNGYCWSYSVGHSIMFDRLLHGMPLVRLNPHATAAIIKGGADEGGWCGLSADFARKNGYAVEGTGPGQWPLHSRDLRYDTPALRESMALHKSVEEYVDLTKAVYDQNLTKQQVATCGFTNLPGPRDYNHWSHSVCGIRWVRISRGNWGQLILNSWLGWGRFGLAVLEGSKAICDGGLAIRTSTPSII